MLQVNFLLWTIQNFSFPELVKGADGQHLRYLGTPIESRRRSKMLVTMNHPRRLLIVAVAAVSSTQGEPTGMFEEVQTNIKIVTKMSANVCKGCHD